MNNVNFKMPFSIKCNVEQLLKYFNQLNEINTIISLIKSTN